MRSLFVALLSVILIGCASKAPPTYTQNGVRLWQANEAAIAIGTLQHAAIELNAVEVCPQDGTQLPCHPALSDANTLIVVDGVRDALLTLKKTPQGWKAITSEGLDRIGDRLEAKGAAKLKQYIDAARGVIAVIELGGF